MVEIYKFSFFLIKYFIDLFREAWDRCRAMTKEQAMLAYIDEIRKVNEKKTKIDVRHEIFEITFRLLKHCLKQMKY